MPTQHFIHGHSAWCVTNSSFAFWSFLEIFSQKICSLCDLLNLWTQNPQIWRASCVPFGVYSTSCTYGSMSSVSFGKFCYYLCKTHICPLRSLLPRLQFHAHGARPRSPDPCRAPSPQSFPSVSSCPFVRSGCPPLACLQSLTLSSAVPNSLSNSSTEFSILL